jgi:hypothetical protein
MPEPVETPPVRTFTENEAYALVADNVQRETAAAKATIETLTSEKAALETKLELADAALATEKARADGAIEWHNAVLEAQTREAAQLARKDERVAKVKEVAPHLKDEFFTTERAERWARQDDEAFEAYVKELAELSTGVTPPAGDGGPPRETAMQGTTVAGAATGPSLLGSLLRGPEKKG